MSRLLNNLKEIEEREKIEVYKKMKNAEETNHLTKIKRELDYKYYICDYCGGEIIINCEKEKRTGGTVFFPKSLTKRDKLQLALHDKCLKLAIKEFEK